MTGIHALAVDYAATTDPAELAAIRASFASLYRVISGLFLAGDILATIGWLLVRIAILRTHVLPRWVGGWTLFSGIVAAAFTPLSEVDPVLAFPLLLAYIVAGIILFHVVFAVKFWKAASRPATA